jgi:hypothetical protein
MDINRELFEIGKLLTSSHLINEVRREVNEAVRDHFAMVVDGEVSGRSGYEVVVMNCKASDLELVKRRIKANIPDVEVDRLIDNVIGIKKKDK